MKDIEIKISMSRRTRLYDNVLRESFIKTLKCVGKLISIRIQGITHNRAKLYASGYATTGTSLILYFLPP
jgi:hypothetical protein